MGYVWLVPVRLAVGIGIYLFLRFEPVTPLYVGAGIFGGTGLLFAKRFGEVLSPIVIGIWFAMDTAGGGVCCGF